jgi:hypothetical protein
MPSVFPGVVVAVGLAWLAPALPVPHHVSEAAAARIALETSDGGRLIAVTRGPRGFQCLVQKHGHPLMIRVQWSGQTRVTKGRPARQTSSTGNPNACCKGPLAMTADFSPFSTIRPDRSSNPCVNHGNTSSI